MTGTLSQRSNKYFWPKMMFLGALLGHVEESDAVPSCVFNEVMWANDLLT